jgi:hypothetical protein
MRKFLFIVYGQSAESEEERVAGMAGSRSRRALLAGPTTRRVLPRRGWTSWS